jgi:hypothetical protein
LKLSLENAFSALLQALALLGNAITLFVKFIFSLVGIDLPDWIIQVAAIIVLLLTVLTLGRKLGKILLVLLVCILVSLGAGLLSGLLKIV